VRGRLQDFIRDASLEQVRAWDDAIPKLQTEVHEVLEADAGAREYSAILEYELPLDSRRPDVVLLVSGAIVVLELKGFGTSSGQSRSSTRKVSNWTRSSSPGAPIFWSRPTLGPSAGPSASRDRRA